MTTAAVTTTITMTTGVTLDDHRGLRVLTSQSLEPLLPPPPPEHQQADEDEDDAHQHAGNGHHHLQPVATAGHARTHVGRLHQRSDGAWAEGDRVTEVLRFYTLNNALEDGVMNIY